MNEYMKYYILGEFAAEQMLKGHIQPDFKLENIGISEKGLIFVDYADMFIRQIPDDLDDNLLRQLTESLFSLVRSINNYNYISIMRVGFIACGGVLADIIWKNMANKGFTSLSYNGIYDSILKYDAINYLSKEITTKQIIQWKEITFDKFKIEDLSNIVVYLNSEIRNETPLLSLFYLDRLYFIICFKNLDQYLPDQVPILIMNMGMSAFSHGEKYCAFGLLSKCINMTETDPEINKQCTMALNQRIFTECLSPALKKLILDCGDYDLFEFLWILNDVDTFEHQLSEI